MYGVIVEVDTSQAETEEALRRLREEIVPGVSQAPGFQSGAWLRDPDNERGFSLVLFASQENAQAAADRFPVGSEVQPGVTIERNEVREVVASA